MRILVAAFTSIMLFHLPRADAAIEPLPGPFGAKGTLLSPTTTPSTTPATSTPANAAPVPGITGGAPLPRAPIASFNCADMRRAALNMSAHTSNLLNRMTTRTADGGPYKRLEVVCKAAGNAFCDIQKMDDERTELQPKSPDADANGYVKLPVINIGTESAGLIAAANELKVIASQGVCGAKAIEQGSLTIVKYDPDFEVMMDTMTFTSDGRLSRWSRTTRDGKTQNLTFKEDGTPVTL